MTIDTELAAIGETGVTPEEEALAAFLLSAIERIKRGEEVDTGALQNESRELMEERARLCQISKFLMECAASVWDSLLGESPPEKSGLQDEIAPAGECVDETPPDPFPGEFAVIRLLGDGRWGRVWLAEDLNLGRKVALKTPRLVGDMAKVSKKLEVLRNEASLLASLRHPNVVGVFGWRQVGNDHYLVLQYVPGGSFADRLKREGALRWEDAARYVADVGEGLVHVHKRGIIHRDIKPANILWDSDLDEAVLTDFGLSRLLTGPADAAGSAGYMAPEAWEGQITEAMDVYSLSVSLFELLTGRLPFVGATPFEFQRQRLDGLPKLDERLQSVPGELEGVVRSGLAALPKERPSLQDLVGTLRASLNRLMADALTVRTKEPPEGRAVDLRIIVSHEEPDGNYVRVAATPRERETATRDMKRVPRAPDQVSLRTGDRVRIEVVADQPGYVAVFNIGPGGNLNLLYPDMLVRGVTRPKIEAHRALFVSEVEIVPPSGRERLFFLWTREPVSLNASELRSLGRDQAGLESKPYQATRDMRRIQASLRDIPELDKQIVLLELDHSA